MVSAHNTAVDRHRRCVTLREIPEIAESDLLLIVLTEYPRLPPLWRHQGTNLGGEVRENKGDRRLSQAVHVLGGGVRAQSEIFPVDEVGPDELLGLGNRIRPGTRRSRSAII